MLSLSKLKRLLGVTRGTVETTDNDASADTAVGGADTQAGGANSEAGGADTVAGGADTQAGGADTAAGGSDSEEGGADAQHGTSVDQPSDAAAGTSRLTQPRVGRNSSNRTLSKSDDIVVNSCSVTDVIQDCAKSNVEESSDVNGKRKNKSKM